MGGKKPVGADPTRGSCRSRRGRHDIKSSPSDRLSNFEGNEFSLFSSVWILGDAIGDHTNISPLDSDKVETNSTTDNRLIVENNENTSISERIERISESLRLLELKFQTLTMEPLSPKTITAYPSFSSLNHFDPNQLVDTDTNSLNATKADVNKLSDRLSTLEGRNSAIQSKMSHLDVAFDGSSSAAWQKGCKKLNKLLKHSSSDDAIISDQKQSTHKEPSIKKNAINNKSNNIKSSSTKTMSSPKIQSTSTSPDAITNTSLLKSVEKFPYSTSIAATTAVSAINKGGEIICNKVQDNAIKVNHDDSYSVVVMTGTDTLDVDINRKSKKKDKKKKNASQVLKSSHLDMAIHPNGATNVHISGKQSNHNFTDKKDTPYHHTKGHHDNQSYMIDRNQNQDRVGTNDQMINEYENNSTNNNEMVQPINTYMVSQGYTGSTNIMNPYHHTYANQSPGPYTASPTHMSMIPPTGWSPPPPPPLPTTMAYVPQYPVHSHITPTCIYYASTDGPPLSQSNGSTHDDDDCDNDNEDDDDDDGSVDDYYTKQYPYYTMNNTTCMSTPVTYSNIYPIYTYPSPTHMQMQVQPVYTNPQMNDVHVSHHNHSR